MIFFSNGEKIFRNLKGIKFLSESISLQTTKALHSLVVAIFLEHS
jgi:hypothetical protein